MTRPGLVHCDRTFIIIDATLQTKPIGSSMNPDLQRLHPYPFEKIRGLLQGLSKPDVANIALSVGEPKHAAPDFVLKAVTDNWHDVEKYPSTRGSDALRQCIADWLSTRYSLQTSGVDAQTQILPINGTREALFAIAQTLLDRTSKRRTVLAPNPFYQIYEGAIFLAGLEPTFYNLSDSKDTRPLYWQEDDARWADVQLMYICNPGNPTGSVMTLQALQQLVRLAERHNFVIISDECYAEVYRDEDNPPPGLVFHSLSKRSNLPGLRSGFVAGSSSLIKSFLLYRTYHGCSMAPPTQAASLAAWCDETHVLENRSEQFTRDMYSLHNISVVPGSYLSREIDGCNPGSGRARLALVAPIEKCIEAAEKIRYYFQHQRSH